MRALPIVLFLLALTACDGGDSTVKGPVNLATLAPLTAREQSLIYGADGAMQQGNIAAAERDYQSAVAISTGHIEAHLALANLYEKQGEPQKQRAVLERALIFQPNHPLANYLIGKLDLDANRFADARAAFARGLASQPSNTDLATGLAVATDMVGEHEAAQTIYQRVLRENPKASLAGLRTNLAMSYLLSGTPKKAVELLQAEAKKPGASSVTRHNLALAYGLLGRNAEAKKVLNGDIDEETRLLAVARLKEYLKERANGAAPAVPTGNFDRDESTPPKPIAAHAKSAIPVTPPPASAAPLANKDKAPAPAKPAPTRADPAGGTPQ